MISRLLDFLNLTKPRVTLMVVLTALAGYVLAGSGRGIVFVWMAIGTGLVAGATGCLNQYLERKEDGLMKRTQRRPLPAGRINSVHALVFGVALAVIGSVILWWKVNTLACLLADFTLGGYLWGYTPLKKKHPIALWVGAVPGAMPPLIGWAAARGSLDVGAWCLFGIQFCWQIPHFLALAWLYREDYAAAGFRVVGRDDLTPDGVLRHMEWASWALLLASFTPTLAGLAGTRYLLVAGLAGLVFLRVVHQARRSLSGPDIRRVFTASLAYLPLLFLFLWVD